MKNHLTPLNLNPATSYLSRRSSAKYFHRKQSLRPCSEWERVVSYRLITGNLSYNQLLLKSHWLHSVLPYPDYCIKLNLYHLCYLLFDIFYLEIPSSSVYPLLFKKLNVFSPLRLTFATAGSVYFVNSTPCGISVRKSPRPISITRLNMLPHLQL